MTLTPELLIALAGFVTAVVSVATQWRAGLLQARKDEVSLSQGEVARLQARVKALEDQLDVEQRNKVKLIDYVANLRSMLIQKGVTLPEMPQLE